MPMTMTQKIMADHAGLQTVEAGDLISCQLDLVLGNDITAPVAIKAFQALGIDRVFDPNKIALVPDHFTPNKDIASAENCACLRAFSKEQNIPHYFEIGEMGIEHALIPEKGLVVAGDLVIGADSHTCTYGALGAFSTGIGSTDMAAGMANGTCWFKVPEAIQVKLVGTLPQHVSGKDVILHLIGRIGVDGARYQSLEFVGEGIATLSMDNRFTIANMAIEAGAKNGIFPVDETTLAYLRAHSVKESTIYTADPDAQYTQKLTIDLSSLSPLVACPHSPDNVHPAALLTHIAIHQVVIGSCTNGRIEDLRIAASYLKDRHVAKGIRTIVIPATQKIYLAAIQEGLVEIFIKAGAIVSTPTCGPCLGGHMGILAKGERALATTNRNFVGRMGHAESEVYLCSPAVAAHSATTGYITCPTLSLEVPPYAI